VRTGSGNAYRDDIIKSINHRREKYGLCKKCRACPKKNRCPDRVQDAPGLVFLCLMDKKGEINHE